MISHIVLGIRDFERALHFYTPLMAALQHKLRITDASVPWAAWSGRDGQRPFFIIRTPWDGQAAHPGNGPMTALLAPDRETVNRCYQIALAHGGTDEGAPGLRPEYHANYWGAYFRDPDGNKLCVVCHS
ncbi:VOC family protein [Massilia sp. TS11]|nr:VOC family protein [Massilia sp. TS11]MCG2584344.1 VOC family protein [Massilia sp. TS11]